MKYDLSRDTRFEVLYNNAQRSADQSEQGMDISGFDAAMIGLDVTGYTDGTTTFAVVHSDDNSTWTEVPDDQLAGDAEPVVDGGGKTGEYNIGYLGSKPYVGIKTTTSGTTSGATWEALAIASAKARAPIGSSV